MTKRTIYISSALAGLAMLAACSNPEIVPPHARPLSKESLMLLGKKGMKQDAPIFVRIFKEESELEVWKQRDDGYYYHFKTYPICNWSGDLGPKLVQGDKQAPEGFYTIHKSQMNPNSSFYLAFNMGYPNSFDKAHGRTGSALMVHGKCRSAGCYAMTDALIEEIYALARDQYTDGNETFPAHAYPFRMTEENMARHKGHKWYPFWQILKEGYDYFETSRQVPPVAVCERKYHVNVKAKNPQSKIEPEARCPSFERPQVVAFKAPVVAPAGQAKAQVAETKIVVPGQKMRAIAGNGAAPADDAKGTLLGLTNSQPKAASGIGFTGSN